jgi:hypothetical protein
MSQQQISEQVGDQVGERFGKQWFIQNAKKVLKSRIFWIVFAVFIAIFLVYFVFAPYYSWFDNGLGSSNFVKPKNPKPPLIVPPPKEPLPTEIIVVQPKDVIDGGDTGGGDIITSGPPLFIFSVHPWIGREEFVVPAPGGRIAIAAVGGGGGGGYRVTGYQPILVARSWYVDVPSFVNSDGVLVPATSAIIYGGSSGGSGGAGGAGGGGAGEMIGSVDKPILVNVPAGTIITIEVGAGGGVGGAGKDTRVTIGTELVLVARGGNPGGNGSNGLRGAMGTDGSVNADNEYVGGEGGTGGAGGAGGAAGGDTATAGSGGDGGIGGNGGNIYDSSGLTHTFYGKRGEGGVGGAAGGPTSVPGMMGVPGTGGAPFNALTAIGAPLVGKYGANGRGGRVAGLPAIGFDGYYLDFGKGGDPNAPGENGMVFISTDLANSLASHSTLSREMKQRMRQR